MPNYMDRPKDMNEFVERSKLPIVIELREKGNKSYFLITDTKKFYDDTLKMGLSGDPYPNYTDLKLLVRKHGKEINSEEFESGEVDKKCMRLSGNYEYTEYTFKSKPSKAKSSK